MPFVMLIVASAIAIAIAIAIVVVRVFVLPPATQRCERRGELVPERRTGLEQAALAENLAEREARLREVFRETLRRKRRQSGVCQHQSMSRSAETR